MTRQLSSVSRRSSRPSSASARLVHQGEPAELQRGTLPDLVARSETSSSEPPPGRRRRRRARAGRRSRRAPTIPPRARPTAARLDAHQVVHAARNRAVARLAGRGRRTTALGDVHLLAQGAERAIEPSALATESSPGAGRAYGPAEAAQRLLVELHEGGRAKSAANTTRRNRVEPMSTTANRPPSALSGTGCGRRSALGGFLEETLRP